MLLKEYAVMMTIHLLLATPHSRLLSVSVVGNAAAARQPAQQILRDSTTLVSASKTIKCRQTTQGLGTKRYASHTAQCQGCFSSAELSTWVYSQRWVLEGAKERISLIAQPQTWLCRVPPVLYKQHCSESETIFISEAKAK